MLFQLEDVQDGAGEKKEQASPADGDEQGNRNVVRGKAACILFAACTDGLAYADFGAHFIEQGDGAGHPRQYAYRTYCSHGLTAQTPYPCHVRQAVGHLDERGGHDGHCQREKLAVDGALCQILCSLHVDGFLGKQCVAHPLFRFLRRRWRRFCLYFRILAYTSQMKSRPKTAKMSSTMPVLRLSPFTRLHISSTSSVRSPKSRIMAQRSTTRRSGYCTGSICRLSAPGRGPKK